MSWNVGQKLHRDKRFVELLDNKLGKFAQDVWGDSYVLGKDLSGGEWSETWLANRQGQKFVVKSLKHGIFNHPENTEDLARYLRYFDEEARALAKCKHPHIVQIIEKLLLPLENNRPCIVMEYIEGVTLSDWVKKHGQLPPLEAVKYVEQIGNALMEMHRQNYLHHDVKHQNIMVRDLATTTGRCEAVLIDLGVARQFIPGMIRSYTFTPGTVGFCPPELELARLEMQKQLLLNPQAEFKLHIEQSESIDVYSLAATLYFMITGKQPRDLPLVIPDYVESSIRDAITSGMARIPELRPKTIAEWLVKLPITFREVWRIEGKVLEFDPNDPNQGTYNLYNRKVNAASSKAAQHLPLEDNRPCIVMEYIEGVTLSDWVKKHGQLPPLEAVKYVEQIGNALMEMHRQNYSHHDVNPQNIMIRDLTKTSGRCEAVLIDLGVARQYFKLHIKQSESIDVYSLAATLYFMITGKQPRDLPLVIPDYVDSSIRDAITSGMARIPKLRPKTIAEWLVKLPINFREVWRIEGKVLEFDPNDPNQGTYNLYDRKVDAASSKAPQLRSAKGIDYRELEQLLKKKEWYEADKLTYRLMLKAIERDKEDWLDLEPIKTFPCEDLQTIDQLWVHYSNGLYGFSVQKDIYVECGGILDFSAPISKTWNEFCDRTAWKSEGNWVDYSDQFFKNNFMSMKGHLPGGWWCEWLGCFGGWYFFSRIKTCEV